MNLYKNFVYSINHINGTSINRSITYVTLSNLTCHRADINLALSAILLAVVFSVQRENSISY